MFSSQSFHALLPSLKLFDFVQLLRVLWRSTATTLHFGYWITCTQWLRKILNVLCCLRCLLGMLNIFKLGWHGGTVSSVCCLTVPRSLFWSWAWVTLCEKFHIFTCVHVGFLRVLFWFRSTSQKHASRWIGYSTLSLGVNECVNVPTRLYSCTQCSQNPQQP